MSAPVDVLAVMDREIDILDAERHPQNKSIEHDWETLREARATVAELIEAAKQAHAFLCEKAPATATEFRLRSALIRAGGAA